MLIKLKLLLRNNNTKGVRRISLIGTGGRQGSFLPHVGQPSQKIKNRSKLDSAFSDHSQRRHSCYP